MENQQIPCAAFQPFYPWPQFRLWTLSTENPDKKSLCYWQPPLDWLHYLSFRSFSTDLKRSLFLRVYSTAVPSCLLTVVESSICAHISNFSLNPVLGRNGVCI